MNLRSLVYNIYILHSPIEKQREASFLHRKGLVIGILILMLGVNIGSSFAGDVDVKTISSIGFDGNTIYVGGSGPNNYTSIQSAINDAVDGDTVFVYSGFYYERIFINVSINLIGEDRNSTIIESDDHSPKIDTVCIYVNDVNIQGFKIQNSSRCGIYLASNNVTIADNIFWNNAHGIHTYLPNQYVEISNNIMSENYCGIYCVSCKNDIIFENKITKNSYGIIISSSSNNQFLYNDISSNTKNGILLKAHSSSNVISKNNFINNSKNAHFIVLSHQNTWDENYWDEPRDSPYIIIGRIGIIVPWINFDWHPAQEPYDI